LAFVACDTGFAPIRSLIEHAIAVDAAEMLSLGWLATRPDGHYLANQCRAWAGAFDQFRYFPAQGGVEAAPALIAAMADARPLAAGDAYVAGPPAFVELAVAALQAHGVPARGSSRRCCDVRLPPPRREPGSMSAGPQKTIPIVAAEEAGDPGCSGSESFALMVLGDSMAPEFVEGEIIVVEPDGHVDGGSYVVAQVAGEWIFRQLVRGAAGWQLRPLNPAYPVVDLDDLTPVRGVVIQKSRPGRRRALKRYVD
jgi:hypothetical protein